MVLVSNVCKTLVICQALFQVFKKYTNSLNPGNFEFSTAYTDGKTEAQLGYNGWQSTQKWIRKRRLSWGEEKPNEQLNDSFSRE